MKVIDLNLLLYTIGKDSSHHAKFKKWLEQVLNDGESIGIPWDGYFGISSSFHKPSNLKKSIDARYCHEHSGWLAWTPVRVLHPAADHGITLVRLLA